MKRRKIKLYNCTYLVNEFIKIGGKKMVVYVCDNISGMISIYANVKTIRYGYAFDSLIFKDGSVLNFHNMIYDINIAD